MPVSGKLRLDWHRKTSAGDLGASTTASWEDRACEPCRPPFEQQPQYKAPGKGASTFLQSGVVQLRGAILRDNARPEASDVYRAMDMGWPKLVGQVAQA